MFRSAIFKLTAAYAVIVMALSVLFSVVFYNLAIRELHNGIYNQYTRWYNAYEPFGLRNPGTPAGELALRSHHILWQLIYFNVLIMLLVTLVSYMLARRTLRPIEAAHEQQKRFTADVSHELRTPLTAIRMESEVSLLDAKASTKDLRSALQSNLEEVNRMEVLINNLLQLSSMRARKLRSEFEIVDCQDVLQEAVQTVQKYADNKHIKIATKLSSGMISADPASLRQLFIILIENAVKYSPEGATVKVGMLRGKNRIIVDVQDKGSGIPSEALPHVFDRFYRADNARSKDAGSSQGYGLGLSLAKVIADLHSAEVVLTSTPRSGTSANVILPALNTKRR